MPPPAAAGLEDLIQPLAQVVAIAIGVLCGSSLYRWLGLDKLRISR